MGVSYFQKLETKSDSRSNSRSSSDPCSIPKPILHINKETKSIYSSARKKACSFFWNRVDYFDSTHNLETKGKSKYSRGKYQSGGYPDSGNSNKCYRKSGE